MLVVARPQLLSDMAQPFVEPRILFTAKADYRVLAEGDHVLELVNERRRRELRDRVHADKGLPLKMCAEMAMLALGIDPCTGRTFYPDDTHESRHLRSA